MRRLLAYEYGEPERVLTVADVPDDPPPAAGEVCLAVRAVGLNFLDVMLCRGTYPRPCPGPERTAGPERRRRTWPQPPRPPFTPGVEVAGTVIAAGAGAEHLAGREVIACPTLPAGALGEQVTVAAELVTPRPADLPPEPAAGLPVSYQTAWFALARAGVTAGETVLVHAGAGGFGIATTQLALALGATVVGTAGGAIKTAVCRKHGAAVAIDYQQEDFVAAVREFTGGRGVDVVVDPVGGDLLGRSLDCLAFEGRLVVVGAAAGAPPPVDPMLLAARNVSLIGLSWGSTYPWRSPEAVRAAYEELFALYRAGQIRPPVSRVENLERAPVALADLAARRSTGKLVIRIGGR